MREEGYYWVNYNDNWMIVRFEPDCNWYLATGSEVPYYDADFEEIGEKIERKEE